MDHVFEAAPYRTNITATFAIKSAQKLMGVLVGAGGGTLKVADGRGNILNTITPTAGTYIPMPCQTSGDVTVTIGGALDCTVFWA